MTTNHLFEHLSTPMILIDLSGKIQALNKQARELLNDVDLAISTDLFALLEKEGFKCQPDAFQPLLTRVQCGENQKLSIERRNGQCFTLHFISNESSIIVEILQENADSLKMKFFDYMIDRIPTKMIFYKDQQNIYRYANLAYVKSFHLTHQDELIGLTDEDLFNRKIISPIVYYQCIRGDEEAHSEGEYLEVEYIEGAYYQIFKKKVGDGIFGIVKDVTEEIIGKQEAECDVITMLQNRKALLKVLNAVPKDTEYYAIGILLDNLGEVARHKGVEYAHQCLGQVSYFVKEYQEILFFYLEGIGFIGLLDKIKGDLEQFRQSIEADISKQNFPTDLKLSTIAIKVDQDSAKKFPLPNRHK